MKYILILREGDQEIIDTYIRSFVDISTEELISIYNQEVSTGITGVHQQALFLNAIDQVFKKRFGRSRILRQSNIIELRWKAELVNGMVRFKPKKTRRQLCQERRVHDLKMKPQPRIFHTRKKKLKISFLSLIIRVDSISKYFNSNLDDFADQYDLYGVSNKKLFIRSEMSGHLPSEIDRIVNEVLNPLGFKDRLDYVIIQEQLITGIGGYYDQLINKLIPDCKNISWLGSIMTKKGHYAWYKSSIQHSEAKHLLESNLPYIIDEETISTPRLSSKMKSARRLLTPFIALIKKDFILGCSPYLFIALIVLIIGFADKFRERMNPVKYNYQKYYDAVESASEFVSTTYSIIASDSIELRRIIEEQKMNLIVLANELKFGIIDSSQYYIRLKASNKRYKQELKELQSNLLDWNKILESKLEELSATNDSLTKYTRLYHKSQIK